MDWLKPLSSPEMDITATDIDPGTDFEGFMREREEVFRDYFELVDPPYSSEESCKLFVGGECMKLCKENLEQARESDFEKLFEKVFKDRPRPFKAWGHCVPLNNWENQEMRDVVNVNNPDSCEDYDVDPQVEKNIDTHFPTGLNPNDRDSVIESLEFANKILLRGAGAGTLAYLYYSVTRGQPSLAKLAKGCGVFLFLLTGFDTGYAAEALPYRGLIDNYYFDHHPASAETQFWNSLATRSNAELRDSLNHVMNLQRHYPEWNPKGYLMAQMVALRLGNTPTEQAKLFVLFKKHQSAGRHANFSQRIEEADNATQLCFDDLE